jgi:hypothetical protein
MAAILAMMLALTIPDPVHPPIFDVVTVTSKRSFDCVSVASLQSIQRFIAPREILVVRPQLWTETDCGVGGWGDNLRCLSEDHIVSGVTKRSLETFYRARGVVNNSRGRSTAGWMLQQIIKLGISARPGLTSWYVVVDSDMIFVRHHVLFTDRGRALLYPGGYGEPYAANVQRMLGTPMARTWTGHTFVSHSMTMQKRHVRSLMKMLHNGTRQGDWVSSVLEATLISKDPTLAFSEYATYATYALSRFPRHYTMAWTWAPFFTRSPLIPIPWTWVRGGCCPTAFDAWTAWLIPTLRYFGFERGHKRACRASLAAVS